VIEEVTLRDGTDAFVVPLQRADRAALVAEYETLSPESQRRRFLAPVRHLSDAMLQHLVDDVDGVDHVALVLCVEGRPGVYDPVALARMVRYADAVDAADLAVTVKDEWQGRGVATVLLEVLVRRRPAGVDRIVTEVLQDNPASIRMLRRLGAVSLEDEGNGVYGVVVELGTSAAVATPAVAAASTSSTRPAPPAEGRPTPLLRDPRHRHELRTRDQVCPWFA